MRIAALSDQHGFLPVIPRCDLLIVAGDICPDRIGRFLAHLEPKRQREWFDVMVRPWLDASPATHKVATWGNHDWCGQGCDFSADGPKASPTTRLQILVDEPTNVEGLRIWGMPWSNEFMGWAFMKAPDRLAAHYDAIPAGTDIVISHQPPFGYGDSPGGSRQSEHIGSRELLAAIDRVRPRLVICGHIHGGHGRYARNGSLICNVGVVDEAYRLVHPATVIDL